MKLMPTALLIAMSALAAPVWAQDASSASDEAAWAFGGTVTGTSDYVWRGVSQTRGKPALQAELSVSHASGFYVGAFASNVDFTATYDEDDGIDYELDPFVGWSGALGDSGTELDVFVSRVTYPGAKRGYNVNYTEIEGKLSFAEHFHAGIAYSPDIFRLGARGIYYNAGVEWPLGEGGFALKGQVGYYDLKKAAGDSYSDYLVGVSKAFGPVTTELVWTDTSSYGPALSENLDEASQADSRVTVNVVWEF